MKLHNSNGKLWERNKYFMSCSSLPRVSGNKRINLVEKSRRSNLVKKMYTKSKQVDLIDLIVKKNQDKLARKFCRK